MAILLGILSAIALMWLPPTLAQSRLPELKTYPLPSFAAAWPTVEADYFDALQTTPVGALIWSRFPVTVYLDPDTDAVTDQAVRMWLRAVRGAIADWSHYFPLAETSVGETADITITRGRPLRRIEIDRANQRLIIPDARHGEARYELWVNRHATEPQLSHRFYVMISPAQTPEHLRGTARHELGHALGIWGHSPHPEDAMYDTQVSSPPPISWRDLSTLKRVYQQGTRLSPGQNLTDATPSHTDIQPFPET